MGRCIAMKKWKWLILMALALFSCTREEEVPEQKPSASQVSVEGQKLKVNFSITGPEYVSRTKVLDNGGDLQHLYLAVFGSSGYLKEYVEADIVRESTMERVVKKKVGAQEIEVTYSIPVYEYTAELTISESPRRIHFLGNGPASLPFGYDTAVMPLQMSQLIDPIAGDSKAKAYWQILDMPNGIRAMQNEDDYYIDADGDVYGSDDFDGFVLSPEQAPLFSNIALIRNWAKIMLYAAEDSNFTPKSLAAINTPARGTVAPYSAQTGFIRNYESLGFDDLKTMKYPANLPLSTQFDASMPTVAEFQATSFVEGGRVAGATTKQKIDTDTEDPGSAIYLYERPAPSEKMPPTYVIIYGHYRNPDEGPDPNRPGMMLHEGDYFYKVDLMETLQTALGDYESSYYPVYRNFKYQIQVRKILSMGQSTPEAAAASAGSADVSADITTGSLSDISDGVGRLHITPWMAQTFIDEHNADNPVRELHVFFSQNTDGTPDFTDWSVQMQLLPPADGGPDIIYRVPDPDNPGQNLPYVGAPDENGWRPITFCTVAPGRTIRSQTIRITGYHTLGRIYRDVVISVQPIQPMWVKCEEKKLNAVRGTPQAVTIGIPEGLTKSMFPLEFTIEAQDLTLSPDNSKPNNNLPVVNGKSISTDEAYAGKPSFQYIRTFTWEEYRNAPMTTTLDERTWRTLTCYFQTNCSMNATTVWVKNKYFDLSSDSFTNYDLRSIHSQAITSPVPQEADAVIPFRFSVEPMDGEGHFPQLTLRVRGMINGSNQGLSRTDDLDVYTFTPTTVVNTLSFITTTIDGDISLEISAPGYNTVKIVPFRFNKGVTEPRSYGMLDGIIDGDIYSNVAFGRVSSGRVKTSTAVKNHNLIFGYFDDPDCINAEITVSEIVGLNKVNPSSYPYKPTGPKSALGAPNYHEIRFNTMNAAQYIDQPVSLQLSAVGYVTETFTYKRIKRGRTLRVEMDGNYMKNGFVNNSYFERYNDYGHVKIVVEALDGAPEPWTATSNPLGLVLGKDKTTGEVLGGRYRLTFHTGDYPANSPAQYKNQRLQFCRFQIEPDYLPVSVTPQYGTYFPYPASNNHYNWSAYYEGEYEEYEGDLTPGRFSKYIEFEAGTDHPIIISHFRVRPYGEF